MKAHGKFTIAAAGVFALACAAQAAVTLGTPFKDGMILQRGMKVPVWGKANPGEAVKVGFAGAEVETKAGKDGRWEVSLPPMEASKKSRTLKVNDIEIKDVLVGEVWFCCGQSNTELPLVGDNPHFTDREGKMVAQLTHKKYIRYAYCCNFKGFTSPQEEYAGDFDRWLEFMPENLNALPSLSAMGVYFALQVYSEIDIPVGIVGAYWGGTNIDAWTPREGYENMPSLEHTANYPLVEAEMWTQDCVDGVINAAHQQPTVLFNSMVAPWVPFAARGLIWYQGCNNSSEPQLYCDKMHALYNGWSKVFRNPGFKLYFVQLAPWCMSWWDIQLAQEKFADEEKNAAMTVSCDVGNFDDIHPNDKGTIGRRLAALALKYDYGFDDIVADYPRVKTAKVLGREVVLEFDTVKYWQLYNSNWDVVAPFEICGEDGVWHKARVVNANPGFDACSPWTTQGRVQGTELRVRSDNVVEPKGIRYLHESPWTGNLFADSGLPLAPFEIRL